MLQAAADAVGAPLLARGRDWTIAPRRPAGCASPTRRARSTCRRRRCPAPHQLDNAGIALAALRAAGLAVPDAALRAGIAAARVAGAAAAPARRGLRALLPPDWELWLDGGHNPGAGVALAAHLARLGATGRCTSSSA